MNVPIDKPPTPGGDLQRLTATRDQHELGPAWNAAGSRIAFWRTPAPFGPGSIWTMTADGADLQQVTSGPALDFEPAWSPDGTRLAFTRGSQEGDVGDVYVIDLATGAVTQVTSSPEYDHQVAWSPDGTRLVFERDSGPSFSIYTVNVDGTELRRVRELRFSESFSDWRP